MEGKTEKKTPKKKVLDEAKVKEAKKKVNDLLAGTGYEDKEEVTFNPPIQDSMEFQPIGENSNANEWLSEQVTGLSQQVEELQNIIAKLRADNTNLVNMLNGGSVAATPGNITDDSAKSKIVELFKHFEGIYTGRNPMRQSFDTVKFSNPHPGNGVLDMFLSTFVFLHEVKDYRHRG